MKDEDKTKEELISELKMLREKYTALKKSLKETILIVDDNKLTRTAIMKMLNKWGYTLLEADSSKKAIEIFKSHGETIHLVLSDVVMPEINGPEMVKKLLKMQPSIKVVFMSGYAGDAIVHDDVFKILQTHAAFIEKPFTFEEIGLIIKQQLDKKI